MNKQEKLLGKAIRDTALLKVSEVLAEYGFGFHYEGSTHRVYKGTKELPIELITKLLYYGIELSRDEYPRSITTGQEYIMYIYYLKSIQ